MEACPAAAFIYVRLGFKAFASRPTASGFHTTLQRIQGREVDYWIIDYQVAAGFYPSALILFPPFSAVGCFTQSRKGYKAATLIVDDYGLIIDLLFLQL